MVNKKLLFAGEALLHIIHNLYLNVCVCETEVLQGEACLALAELAHGHTENQDLICGACAVPPVVQVLSSRKISSQVKAAKVLEAIAHQNPVVQEQFLNKSAARLLLRLLKVTRLRLSF